MTADFLEKLFLPAPPPVPRSAPCDFGVSSGRNALAGRSATATGAAAALTVSEFTRRVKTLLEGEFPFVSVRGEVSNLRRQPSGHVYFTLKDAGAQLPVVLFRGDAVRIPFEMRDGMQVVATGGAGLYEPRGAYQLIARRVEADGVGRLRLEFERLRAKLAAEGLFDAARKRPLPVPPRAVGVVTSPVGAALQDFLRILRRRGWRGRIVVLPARVQGAEAAAEIEVALALAPRLGFLDMVVVTRGGGGIEDLWPFNEERVARAVRASPLPVVSAVGHETDTTLCDLAADVRAETPSGAAELISSLRLECAERAGRALARLSSAVLWRVAERGRRLARAAARLAPWSPERRVEGAWLRLDDLRNRLQTAPARLVELRRRQLAEVFAVLGAHSPAARLALARQRCAAASARLCPALVRAVVRARERVGELGRRLQTSGVESALRRGFALVLDSDGHLVRSAAAVRAGMPLRLRFADGIAPAAGV